MTAADWLTALALVVVLAHLVERWQAWHGLERQFAIEVLGVAEGLEV